MKKWFAPRFVKKACATINGAVVSRYQSKMSFLEFRNIGVQIFGQANRFFASPHKILTLALTLVSIFASLQYGVPHDVRLKTSAVFTSERIVVIWDALMPVMVKVLAHNLGKLDTTGRQRMRHVFNALPCFLAFLVRFLDENDGVTSRSDGRCFSTHAQWAVLRIAAWKLLSGRTVDDSRRLVSALPFKRIL